MIRDFINGQENTVLILIQILKILMVLLVANAIIELIMRIKFQGDERRVDTFYKIQGKSNDYIMMVISLIAIYAAVKPNSGDVINAPLLAIGIVMTVSVIVIDIYKSIFLESKFVKILYFDLMVKYNTYIK